MKKIAMKAANKIVLFGFKATIFTIELVELAKKYWKRRDYY